MSPWGYLVFTCWATTAAVLADGWHLAGLGLVVLAFGLCTSRRRLQLLAHRRFWILILAAVAFGPFMIGEPDAALGPLSLSSEGFTAGLEMAARAFVLVLAFSLGVGSLSLSDIVALFDRLGLRGLGFATALALNALETLQEMATETLQTIWLRGGLRRPWLSLKLFLVTTIANTLRYGDQAINAAAMRAFDPAQNKRTPLPLRRTDVCLFVLLTGCSGALLAAGWL